jgi:hypothetical protein
METRVVKKNCNFTFFNDSVKLIQTYKVKEVYYG